MIKKLFIFLILISLLYVGFVWSKAYIQFQPFAIGFGIIQQNYINISSQKPSTNTISYKGENGKDALSLLRKQEHAWIEQDNSGMITAINGKKAEKTKHEYWAFYINGKLADVGAAQYITKNTDTLSWKIQTY